MEGMTRIPVAIRASDCDRRAGLRMDAFFVQMQECAEMNAAGFGAGSADLAARGLFFALSRIEVVMARPPRFGEQLIHSTWPGTTNRFFYPRYHTLETADGERVASAASLWVTLSREARTVVPPAKSGLVFPDTSDIPAPLPLPLRMPAFPDAAETMRRAPRYSDFDLNGHVNNTRYLAWLGDALTEALQTRFIHRLTVSFEKEIRDSAPCLLALSQREDHFDFRILSEGGERHFSASGQLAPRAEGTDHA